MRLFSFMFAFVLVFVLCSCKMNPPRKVDASTDANANVVDAGVADAGSSSDLSSPSKD